MSTLDARARELRRLGLLCVGPAVLDTGQRVLRWPGGVLPLPPHAARLLAECARTPGLPVSRRDLAAAIWPPGEDRSEFADQAIAHQITRLNRALDAAGAPLRLVRLGPQRGVVLEVRP